MNPEAFRHMNLNHARLPIPPVPLAFTLSGRNLSFSLKYLYLSRFLLVISVVKEQRSVISDQLPITKPNNSEFFTTHHALLSTNEPWLMTNDQIQNSLSKPKLSKGNNCRNTEINTDICSRDKKIHSLNFYHLNVESKPNFCQRGYGLTRFGGQSHYYYP